MGRNGERMGQNGGLRVGARGLGFRGGVPWRVLWRVPQCEFWGYVSSISPRDLKFFGLCVMKVLCASGQGVRDLHVLQLIFCKFCNTLTIRVLGFCMRVAGMCRCLNFFWFSL